MVEGLKPAGLTTASLAPRSKDPLTPMWQVSVASRLALIYLFLGATVLLTSAVGWRALDAQDRAMTQLTVLGDARRYLQNADMMHDAVRADVFAVLLVESSARASASAELAAFAQDSHGFIADLDALGHLPLPTEVRQQLDTVRPRVENYITAGAAVNALATEDVVAAKNELLAFRALFEELVGSMGELTGLLSRHIATAEANAFASNRNNARQLLLAGFGISLIVSVLLAGITRSIRNSLAKLNDVLHVTRAITAGDLLARCALKSQDEIGELASTINTMADELQGTIERMRSEAERDAFRSRLIEALEMADTEPATHSVVARAMLEVSDQHPIELLMSDSSRAHLNRVTEHPATGAPQCRVESPFNCVAVRRGYTLTFTDSEALNACPQLRGRPNGPSCVVCVPISFMGRSLGVLHASGPREHLPTPQQVAQLTTLGTQAGARIGTVRAFAETQSKAATDSLTGLANRRTLEAEVNRLSRVAVPYALVMVDLDHFKRLNDTYGHEAGDAALRRFATIARACLRDGDTAARWGGEEFALLLPHASGAQALDVCERIRDELASTARGGVTPAFTASFGIVESNAEHSLEQLLRAADHALYASKHNGRDRATLGHFGSLADPPARTAMAGDSAINLKLIAEEI